MLSIVVLARNCRAPLSVCLQSVLDTADTLRLTSSRAEYVLIDDCSDQEHDIVGLYRDFRSNVDAKVRILRFVAHLHYAHGVAYGLSLARGDQVLFLSHDMALTADCLSALLLVATTRPEYGIIRPVSGHMDGAPDEVVCQPPFPLRDLRDVRSFSRYVARTMGDAVVDADYFIGDAMLVDRRVLDRLGVFDTRFRGFFADVDFGLRAQRAGFRVGTARGAWLHHEGSAFSKDGVLSGKFTGSEVNEKNWADVCVAYGVFREKWASFLPPRYAPFAKMPFAELRALPPALNAEVQPRLEVDPSTGELL